MSPSPLPFLLSPLSPSSSSPSFAVTVEAEIVIVELRHHLPLPMAVRGGQRGRQRRCRPPRCPSQPPKNCTVLVRRRRLPCRYCSRTTVAAIIVGLLEHTIVLLTIFVVSLLFLCVVSNTTMMTTKTMSPVRPFDCWRRSPQMTTTARTIAFLP